MTRPNVGSEYRQLAQLSGAERAAVGPVLVNALRMALAVYDREAETLDTAAAEVLARTGGRSGGLFRRRRVSWEIPVRNLFALANEFIFRVRSVAHNQPQAWLLRDGVRTVLAELVPAAERAGAEEALAALARPEGLVWSLQEPGLPRVGHLYALAGVAGWLASHPELTSECGRWRYELAFLVSSNAAITRGFPEWHGATEEAADLVLRSVSPVQLPGRREEYTGLPGQLLQVTRSHLLEHPGPGGEQRLRELLEMCVRRWAERLY